jgi:hypothetical protein
LDDGLLEVTIVDHASLPHLSMHVAWRAAGRSAHAATTWALSEHGGCVCQSNGENPHYRCTRMGIRLATHWQPLKSPLQP